MRKQLVTLAVVGLFAACGFPQLTYETGDGGGEGGVASEAGGDGAQSAEGASGGDGSSGDGPGGDGTTSGDGSGKDGPAGEDSSSGDGPVSDGPSSDGPLGDGEHDASDRDGGGDSSASGDGSGDGATVSDGNATDAPHDGATDGPVESGPVVCDNDGDQDIATGAVCGGTDCDDNDKRAYVGQDFLTFQPTATTKGDWNCNGILETLYPVNVSCNLLALGAGCDATFGFADNPGCGNSDTIITCVSSQLLGLCTQAAGGTTKTQGCK